MTKLESATSKAIVAWCEEHGMGRTEKPRHIYPRAYVLSKAASQCLFVTVPNIDAEPQVQKTQEIMEADGGMTVHKFDENLKAGDWCSVAYVCHSGGQESVAIPAVKP